MARSLRPSRALLHPAWLMSLVLLALNDHVLKGAGVLPGAVTGKLSDLAGLMVAPLLLAALLDVRRLSSWVACHVAVGLGFAAIQLSPAAALAATEITGALGVRWTITPDLTDLWALPMLAVSLWGLLPAMRRRARANARRSAECAAATVGLWACVATSSEPDPEPFPSDWGDETTWGGPELEPDLPTFRADVFLSNTTGETLSVRIRPLLPDVVIDCQEIEAAPGQLLRSSLFAPARTWSLPPEANLAVLENPGVGSGCNIAWVESDRLRPVIVLWRDGDPTMTDVPSHGPTSLPGELRLGYGGEGDLDLALDGRADLVHETDLVEPDPEGTCAAQPDGERIAWSDPVPWGPAQIEAVEEGFDGCFGLDLLQGGTTTTWYLCVPSTSFPFAAGDAIDLRLVTATAPGTSGPIDAIEIAGVSAEGEPTASLTVSAGAALPAIEGLQLGALPVYSCEASSEPSCGTVARPMTVVVDAPDLGASELLVGEPPVRIAGDGRMVEMTLLHAQDRYAFDPRCALGPTMPGTDLELVIAQWPTP